MRKWILLAGISVLMIGVLAMLYSMRIVSVTYVGNTYYDAEKLNTYLFQKSYSLNPLYCFFDSRYGEKEEIPFVETYDIEFTAWNKIKVEVYEKSIAGYVEYKDYQMYFDNEGIIVESSKDKLEHVIKIDGLKLEHMILHERLPVENNEIFHLILVLTQTLSKYSIEVDRIVFDEAWNIVMEIDGIRVQMGDDSYLNEKIAKLSDLLPGISQKRGNLHMEEFKEDTEIFRFTLEG